jgi:hypothetical protein
MISGKDKGLQGGAIQRPARETSVIIEGLDEPPVFVGLALDIGLCSLALGI